MFARDAGLDPDDPIAALDAFGASPLEVWIEPRRLRLLLPAP
jgi:hypothetical protein